MKSTWILIANSSEARLYKSEKPFHEIKLLKEFSHPESREKVLDLVSDGLGRYNVPVSSRGGIYEEPSNPKQVEADRFARELAEKLNKGRIKNQYSNLIIIAPPQFHGLLNKHFNNHVLNLIKTTLEKDYTKVKEHDLVKLLNSRLSHRAIAA